MLLVGAGMLLSLAPMSAGSATMSSTWWSAPFRPSGLAEVAFATLAFTAVVGVAALWDKATGDGPLDIMANARSLGLVLAITGVMISAIYWFVLLTSVSSDRVVIEPGEQIQSYSTTVAGVKVSQMLPIRASVESVDLSSDVPGIEFSFMEAGSDEAIRETLGLGDGVNVEGIRFTPVGLDTSTRRLVGTFEGTSSNTISATAGVGQSFKVSLEGDSYRVEEIVRDYMGAVGAAARIQPPDGETYWVFRKQTVSQSTEPDETPPGGTQGSAFAPDFEHPVRLTEVRDVPVPEIAVTPVQPLWPLSVGGLTFMVGFGVIVGAGRPASRSDNQSQE
jgi:hypothetical protein